MTDRRDDGDETRRPSGAPDPDGAAETAPDFVAQVPGQARPVGIALAFDGERFTIRVVDEAGSPCVTLGSYEEDEVVAVWRSLAGASGLPLLVPGPDGRLEQPYPQIGRIVPASGPSAGPPRAGVGAGQGQIAVLPRSGAVAERSGRVRERPAGEPSIPSTRRPRGGRRRHSSPAAAVAATSSAAARRSRRHASGSSEPSRGRP